MCFNSVETSGLCLGLWDHDIFLSTVGDRWVSCQLDAKTIRTNELFKNRTIAFGKGVGGGWNWEGNNSPMILSWYILNKTCCDIVFVSNEVTNWSASKMAGSKLLSYWPEMSAAIMFCWPLIASRVAFSSVKWKKFHLSDLSVSWCLWSMIVMGNDSAFISSRFSVHVKWIVNLEVIYTVRVCFVQEQCICSSRRSSTSPSYSQKTKVVSTSNLFHYLPTHVHRVGLWHSNVDIALCRQTQFFRWSYAKNMNIDKWYFW